MGRPSVPVEDRFWTKVQNSGECWIWTGARASNGYGRITSNRASLSAHRVSYELTKGHIPAGMLVRHTCDNPPCVRPDHLALGTPRDNTADMFDRQRSHWSGRSECKNGHPYSERAESGKCRGCNRLYKSRRKAVAA